MASKNAAEAALSSTDLLRKVQEEVLPALEPSIKPTQQGQSTRWNSILVFSDKPVPTTPEAFDELYPPGKEGKERLCASASFTVLECLRAGFEKTPKRTEGAGTKNAKYIEDADAKLLAALQPAPDGSPAKGMQMLRCHPYLPGVKVGYKGERVDDEGVPYDIIPGMVLQLSIFRQNLEKKGGGGESNPGIIPAFQVLKMTQEIGKYTRGEPDSSKGCNGGYGMGIASMAVAKSSLYSYVHVIAKVLPETVEEARKRQSAYADIYPSIRQQLQLEKCPFFVQTVRSCSTFTVDEENEVVKISDWDVGNAVDIDLPICDALRFTNCKTVQDCCKLMELACMHGCMSLLASYDSYRDRNGSGNSCYVGVPIIRVDKLFRGVIKASDEVSVSEDGHYVQVPSLLEKAGDDAGITLALSTRFIGDESSVGGPMSSCSDLCLISPGLGVERGCFVRFISAEGDVLWGGFINVQGGSRVIRKRWCTGQSKAEAFDPFSGQDEQVSPVASRTVSPSAQVENVVEEEEEEEEVPAPKKVKKESKKEKKDKTASAK